MMDLRQYQNPLIERYASPEMSYIFSHHNKLVTQRDLWIALAEAEKELGLPITDEQVEELRRHRDDINYEEIVAREREVRHDVMAHIHAYGLQCPAAKAIIHLGATSCFVTDNGELIQLRAGLDLLKRRLVNAIAALREFAWERRRLPTLGFTHFQPAQLTTVGKRATLWLQELMLDLGELGTRSAGLRFRGVKGTTGTQASFLDLFDGDEGKVRQLDRMVTERMGFDRAFLVTGQTYSRKVDSGIAAALSGIAQSAHKFSNDLRLLQGLKEIEEPFGKRQIGSSAMAYKRNPMRSERIGSLARYVITAAQSPAFTAASQWFERTLDDSANRRIVLAEMFLAVDGILILYTNIARGLVVYPKMIERHIEEELPFMATENILMEVVKRGGDRQVLHERIRQLAMDAGERVKKEGKSNDLLERIATDESFGLSRAELAELLDTRKFIGRAPSQVEEFLREEVDPVLEQNSDLLGADATVRV